MTLTSPLRPEAEEEEDPCIKEQPEASARSLCPPVSTQDALSQGCWLTSSTAWDTVPDGSIEMLREADVCCPSSQVGQLTRNQQPSLHPWSFLSFKTDLKDFSKRINLTFVSLVYVSPKRPSSVRNHDCAGLLINATKQTQNIFTCFQLWIWFLKFKVLLVFTDKNINLKKVFMDEKKSLKMDHKKQIHLP